MPEKIVYMESTMQALKEVPYGDIKANMVDPITKKPYRGIVLEGVFADLNPKPNRNQRIYDIPTYLEHLRKLKEMIHTPKGIYGELEHPQKYNVDFNNVSHKLLDVWFDENTNFVYGRVILLNTPKGKIAQQIIKSGGQLAISARAAGDEQDMPDGTKAAVVQLLTTFDLVYRPGFPEAVLEFKELNESEKYIQDSASKSNGFAIVIKASQLKNLNESYMNYINVKNLSETERTERRSKCFMEWFALNESDDEQKAQQILQKNEPTDETEKQNQLSRSVDKELTQSVTQRTQSAKQLNESARYYKRAKKQARTLFDGSAGFINTREDNYVAPGFDVGGYQI